MEKRREKNMRGTGKNISKRRAPEFTKGLGRAAARELRITVRPTAVAAALCAPSALFAAWTDSPAAYALLCVVAAAIVAAPAVSSARLTMRDASSPPEILPHGKKLRADTFALAKCISVAVVSVISALSLLFAVRMTWTPTLGASAALAGFGATVYMTLVADATALTHTVRDRRERRGFICGFVGLYTVGLLALLLVAVCFSGVPLGGDFGRGEFPERTVLALSAIYLFGCAIRSTALFFVLRRRSKSKMKLR